jgi:hypothetical protein
VNRAQRSAQAISEQTMRQAVAAQEAASGFNTRGSGTGFFSVREPLIADVNGDGAEDAIVEYSTSSDEGRLIAAYDGRTGGELWKTTVPLSPDAFRVLSPTRVLAFDPAATVRAFELRTGRLVWSERLSDRASDVCVEADRIVVRTTDNADHVLKLSDGSRLGAPPARVNADGRVGCTPAPTSADPGFSCRVRTVFGSDLSSLGLPKSFPTATFSPECVVGEQGAKIVVGTRRPGTAVPEIVGFDGTNATFRATVPEGDPLLANWYGTSLQRLVHAAHGVVAAVYEGRAEARDGERKARLAVFDAKSGEKRFDAPLAPVKQPWRTVVVTRDAVFAFSTYALYAHDLRTGALLYRVGPAL